MKKLFLAVVAICLFASSCGQKKAGTDETETQKAAIATATAKMVCLNGIPEAEARTIIKAFKANTISNKPYTSFWFKYDFVEAALKILSDPALKIDGIRIHLAKDAQGLRLVILPTTDDGASLKGAPSGRKHKDFFFEESQIMQSADVKIDPSYTKLAEAGLFWKVCEDGSCPSSSKNFIDCVTAHALVSDYVTAHSSAGTLNLKTTSVWFPKDLFGYIKANLDSARPNGKKGDGIRIYLVRELSGRDNFVIVPTVLNASNQHEDDYTCFPNEGWKSWRAWNRGEECEPFCESVITP
jgi:hypothetical protein